MESFNPIFMTCLMLSIVLSILNFKLALRLTILPIILKINRFFSLIFMQLAQDMYPLSGQHPDFLRYKFIFVIRHPIELILSWHRRKGVLDQVLIRYASSYFPSSLI